MATAWPWRGHPCPGRPCSSRGATSSSWPPPARAPGRARQAAAARGPAPRRARRRSTARGIAELYSHQADALGVRARRATRSSPRARRAASRWPSTCPCSTRSPATAARARSTSTRPRRSPRTRRASCTRSGAPFLRPAIYDGDTPREERKAIRRRANLMLTNPDMLHRRRPAPAPLVRRRTGQPRLGRGRRGARVPRRVRLARGQRAAPPAAAGQRVRHRAPLRPRQRDDRQPRRAGRAADRTRRRARGRATAPRGPSARWPCGTRRWSTRTRARACPRCPRPPGCSPTSCEREVRTICFLKSRRGVELIQRFTRLRLEDAGRPDLAERIAPYRAGYTPAQRREIERRLSDGELLAVVATTALELGIDVGDLDAAICRDLPGHGGQPAPDVGPRGAAVARASPSTWPATTRSTSSSAATPTAFLDRPVERAILDPRVRGDPPRAPAGRRLRAAAVRRRRAPRSGRAGRRYAERLVKAGRAARAGRPLHAAGRGLPGRAVSLRSAQADAFAVRRRRLAAS